MYEFNKFILIANLRCSILMNGLWLLLALSTKRHTQINVQSFSKYFIIIELANDKYENVDDNNLCTAEFGAVVMECVPILKKTLDAFWASRSGNILHSRAN